MKTEPNQPVDGIWRFPFCPQGPSWTLDFDALAKRFDWVAALADCPQDPQYHAEGDVLTHVRMVCEELVKLDAWRRLPEQERHILFASAVFHDIAKPKCTREENDRIVSPGHSLAGARMARRIMMENIDLTSAPAPFAVREQICALVRHHMLPPRLIDKPDPTRAVLSASMTTRLDLLCILVEADLRGRIFVGFDDAMDRLELFRDYAKEHDCLARPYAFATDQTRFRYFQTGQIPPTAQLYADEGAFTVTLLSGIPAAGKDSWLKAHRQSNPDVSVISLDDIRAELGVEPDESQTPVLETAKARAKTLLRTRTPFIWNATNTTRMLREGLIGLMAGYGARVRVVYVEAPLADVRARNARRAKPVPEWVMEKLLDHLEIPDATEAHEVVYP